MSGVYTRIKTTGYSPLTMAQRIMDMVDELSVMVESGKLNPVEKAKVEKQLTKAMKVLYIAGSNQ
jgi:hypothetical protein